MSKRLVTISISIVILVALSMTLWPVVPDPDFANSADSSNPNPVDTYDFGPIDPEEIQFYTIAKGYECTIYDARNLTISDNETWYGLWQDMHSYSTNPIPPYVNFTCEWVVAVFLGRRSNSGYEANITMIGRTSLVYKVFFTETTATGGGFMDVIEPYHIVKISSHPLDIPVEFVKSYVEGGDIYQ